MTDATTGDGALLQEMKQITRWLKVLALPTLRESLHATLKKPEERRVYQASDGRSVEDVRKSAGVAYGTVINYWNRWSKLGLVQATETNGRYERLLDLRDVGIEVEEVSNAGNA